MNKYTVALEAGYVNLVARVEAYITASVNKRAAAAEVEGTYLWPFLTVVGVLSLLQADGDVETARAEHSRRARDVVATVARNVATATGRKPDRFGSLKTFLSNLWSVLDAGTDVGGTDVATVARKQWGDCAERALTDWTPGHWLPSGKGEAGKFLSATSTYRKAVESLTTTSAILASKATNLAEAGRTVTFADFLAAAVRCGLAPVETDAAEVARMYDVATAARVAAEAEAARR